MLSKLSSVLILLFIALIEPLSAIAQQTQSAPQPPQEYYWPGPWHMWNGAYGWSFWWTFPVMMLFMVFFCIVMFAAWRFCIHGSHPWGWPSHMTGRSWSDSSHSALQILNERFARGEIDKDEYVERKDALLSDGRR